MAKRSWVTTTLQVFMWLLLSDVRSILSLGTLGFAPFIYPVNKDQWDTPLAHHLFGRPLPPQCDML